MTEPLRGGAGRKPKHNGVKLTPAKRLKMIAEILEARDAELVAADGPVPQEPIFLRRIYLLAIGPQREKGKP